MGFLNCLHSSEEIEKLAVQLALLYIEKSDKPVSNPNEFALEFVNVQNAIADELMKIN